MLSGCGVSDGAEIHEATLTLLAITQQKATYEIFAPDIDQHHVINHLTGEEMPEKRNVLVESARIARGNIKPLSQFRAAEYDAIIFPGGYGAGKNLSTFAFDGSNAKVIPEVERAVREMHGAGKPIGALCVTPALITKILGNITVTMGDDPGDAAAIEEMGGTHVKTTHGQVIADEKNKVFSSPCYMLDANIEQVYEGISNTVKEMLKNM